MNILIKYLMTMVFCMLTAAAWTQSIIRYSIVNTNPPNEITINIELQSVSGAISIDNASCHLLVPQGTAIPNIGSLDNGSWDLTKITAADVNTYCGSSMYDVLKISTTDLISIAGGAVTNGLNPVLNLIFTGTNLNDILGFDPSSSDALQTCIKNCGINNTGDIVLSSNSSINTGWEDLVFDAACVQDLVITDNPSLGLYDAANSIMTSGTVIIGGATKYDAGNFIELQPGFEAPVNHIFEAVIGGCN